MVKKAKILIVLLTIAVVLIFGICIVNKDSTELKSVTSNKQLQKIYDNKPSEVKTLLLAILTMPFSAFENKIVEFEENIVYDDAINFNTSNIENNIGETSDSQSSSIKDYSTTNIQVESVDEADITKTDGNYIYSISDNNVIITNVIDPKNIKIESKISFYDSSIPEDLILYNDKLVVISTKIIDNSYSYYRRNSNTLVSIYDIKIKSEPKKLKDYEMYEPYYTSRCIDNKLYVISSGRLREDYDDEKIIDYYEEDGNIKNIDYKNIKYLKELKTNKQTLISYVDLDNLTNEVDISSYLIDITNAYVSKDNIYLLDQKYSNDDVPKLSDLWGIKGVIGFFASMNDIDNDNGYSTKILKFNIDIDGKVKYDKKTTVSGKTINQYSLDEKDGHLRIALQTNKGTRVVILDEDLDVIGETKSLAKGERMYSSRFLGDKVYLVTYKTIDPLFVIDLSNESSPKVLGELKIPGYSTYLHPYDENHIIGIGMETEEVVKKDSNGKVIRTTSKIIGMKMALFDVSNVNNPTELDSIVIGDRKATSAILTNPKALLFSKEKNLIAIPVNNYSEDFEIETSSNLQDSIINSYKNYNKEYISEGYFVYNIDLENGFNLKGIINHAQENYKYSYYNVSKMLRGMYIDNNLYTVSECAVKVNDLNSLELISELKIK